MIKVVAYSFAVLCLGYISLEECKETGLYPSEKAFREIFQLASDPQEVFFEESLEEYKKPREHKKGPWECRSCHACNPNYKLYCKVCWN